MTLYTRMRGFNSCAASQNNAICIPQLAHVYVCHSHQNRGNIPQKRLNWFILPLL